MGTAAIQGELWGARAQDWAEVQEPAWTAVYSRVLDLAGVASGTRLLDIGRGSGGALLLARARGAEVDAAELPFADASSMGKVAAFSDACAAFARHATSRPTHGPNATRTN